MPPGGTDMRFRHVCVINLRGRSIHNTGIAQMVEPQLDQSAGASRMFSSHSSNEEAHIPSPLESMLGRPVIVDLYIYGRMVAVPFLAYMVNVLNF